MNRENVNRIVQELIEIESKIFSNKGDDYTNDENDRLANFKRNAQLTGMTPIQVWAIYFMKHVDAIMTFVKTGKTASENIVDRVHDARNYLALLACLTLENKNEK